MSQETIDIKPTSIYSVFETDEELETKGVVFDCGFGKFTVASASNMNFQKAYAEAMKPVAEAQARGLLDGKIHMKILRRVYAETIVLGWEGVIGRDGEEIKYSPDACEKLLTDLPRLFGLIREWAGNFANYRRDYAEEVVKN